MPPTTYKLRTTTEQQERWQKAANKAKLKLAEWIRKNCDDVADGVVIELRATENANGDGKDVRGVEGVRVVERGAARPEPRRDAAPAVDLAAVAEQTRARRISDSSIEVAVASRNPGHEVGCECMACVQTYRFIEAQRKTAEKEEPKKKVRR